MSDVQPGFYFPPAGTAPYPIGGFQLLSTSGNVANATASTTISNSAGKFTYVAGVLFTALGATAGLGVIATVTGLPAGQISAVFGFPAGVLVAANPLLILFNPALPSSVVQGTITASLPAGGSGNTNACVSMWGFAA